MPDGLTLRAARDDEGESLLRLMKSSIRSYCAAAYGQEVIDAWLDENTSSFDFRLPEHCFVAEEDGAVVAFSGWRLQEGEDGLARITALFVAPGEGRRGLGRAVLARAEEHIAVSGFSRIHLFASLNAVPLYLSMGYEEIARENTEVAEGHEIELVRMMRDVTALTGTRL